MKTNKSPQPGGPLIISVADKHESEQVDALLRAKHPQESPDRVGQELRLIIKREDEWVGVMLWSSPCQRLQDRDEWIGWTHAQRAERLKLVVQLKRYLLLHERGNEPNLASQALAAATRALPELWEKQFGFAPLLAESFSDIEAHAGTCYKAAGWKAVGLSKGYAKHRGDSYSHHGRPKKLWVRPFRKQAVKRLRAIHLPARYEAGLSSCIHGQLPFPNSKIPSLSCALRQVPDPRAKNRSYPLGPLLSVVAMALLSGARDMAQIHRFSWRLLPAQRAALGFRRKPGKKTYQMPGYSVYRDLLIHLDLDAFARILSAWLLAQRDGLPEALALDGKMIRDTVGILSVVDTQTGIPVAMRVMNQKEGDGKNCEKCVARTVVSELPDAQGALLSGDALHTDKKMARMAVKQGADYLLQVKGNQPKVKKYLAQKTDSSPFLK